MKKRYFQYAFLIICILVFSTKSFSQAPTAPGDDPMKADSAKYMLELQRLPNNELTSAQILIEGRKAAVTINQIYGSPGSGKTDEEENQQASK
jgi:hypothetical protein